MKFLIKVFLGSYLVIFFFQSCNQRENNKSINSQTISDSFISDVPLDSKGKKMLGYYFAREMEEKLNLENITMGFDSLQLRIWYSYAADDSGQLVLLKYQNDRWSGRLCTYIFPNSNAGQEDTVATFTNGFPKSGWGSLLSQLHKLDIFVLPDMDKINHDIVIVHGDAITVEYATKSKYRLYQYVNPRRYQDKWKEARMMENILQVIENEFGFERFGKK